MHDLGFLHRDIKPANFVIGAPGTKDANTVYVVDYGIARKILDAKGSMLTPRRKVKKDKIISKLVIFKFLDKVQRHRSLRPSDHAQDGGAWT